MYVKKGYTITSRGCPNRCWFCSVWKREGDIRELAIQPGSNLLDDNLLACSDAHIQSVFDMLKKQPRVQFTGGLEAARLKPWHARELRKVRPKQVFFAYDTPDDFEPLRKAAELMLDAGFTVKSHCLRCFVLCGFPKDTLVAAEKRMRDTIELGFTPMAMAWRNPKTGEVAPDWKKFQRSWARPAAIHAKPKSKPKSKPATLQRNLTDGSFQHWNTPPEILDPLRAFLPITLDPCSNPRSVVGAQVEIMRPDDGLAIAWHLYGHTFVNPPYIDQTPWLCKAAAEHVLFGATVTVLIPASVETGAFRDFAFGYADAIAFWNKRIRFLKAGAVDGGTGSGNSLPSALVYFGPEPGRFTEHFSKCATVVHNWSGRK